MGKPTGFMEFARQDAPKRPVAERIHDFREIEQRLPLSELETQAARCMDCGIPFCHAGGCPVRNLIPDWNDMVYRGQWRRALELLHATNNLPEITGRICPAPCEPACTLSINALPVTIRNIELQIVERGWREGWIVPLPAPFKTGRRVAVVGSGPAGLAAAQQLARRGHAVTVFEKADRIGGILRYGIPDFKLEKWVIDRRLEQMTAEGVVFEPKANVGSDISIRYLLRSYDAVLLAGGAMVPRDLEAPGRALKGVHFAMDFLTQQNRRTAGDAIAAGDDITAAGREVVVIGGGDTGADCVGTSIRQGAAKVTQIEIMPQPPSGSNPATPWPAWPNILRSSTSHQEGCERHWSTSTAAILDDGQGRVRAIRTSAVEWTAAGGANPPPCRPLPGSERELPAELVLLAMGFTRQGNAAILKQFGLKTNPDHTAWLDDNYMSSAPGVFVAGDLAKGASLVVRAIFDGRAAAAGIDRYLRELKRAK